VRRRLGEGGGGGRRVTGRRDTRTLARRRLGGARRRAAMSGEPRQALGRRRRRGRGRGALRALGARCPLHTASRKLRCPPRSPGWSAALPP